MAKGTNYGQIAIAAAAAYIAYLFFQRKSKASEGIGTTVQGVGTIAESAGSVSTDTADLFGTITDELKKLIEMFSVPNLASGLKETIQERKSAVTQPSSTARAKARLFARELTAQAANQGDPASRIIAAQLPALYPSAEVVQTSFATTTQALAQLNNAMNNSVQVKNNVSTPKKMSSGRKRITVRRSNKSLSQRRAEAQSKAKRIGRKAFSSGFRSLARSKGINI